MTRRGRRRLYVIGFAGALGLGAPIWAPPMLSTLPVFRVERVGIFGTVFVGPDEVLDLAEIEPNASVWSDGSAWEKRVRAHPLVREARVRRTGLREIEIRVVEVRPLAFVVGETLVPVDVEGRRLPLDPATARLNLPVLMGRAEMEDGRLSRSEARPALRALAALREYDDAFFGQISEVRPIGTAFVEIQLIESGPTERVLLPTGDPVRGLRRVELALGHASGLSVTVADARFDGQVVLHTREEG